MGILDEDVVRVREATDVVGLISERLALKRVGRRFVGLCPFHTEKTPSFSVNPDLGLYHCLAGETGVVTWDGVRPIRELAGGTHRILTTNGLWVDAPFYSFGVQRLWRVTLSRNGVRKEIFATEGHRWFVRAGVGNRSRSERTTAELRPGHYLCKSFPHRAIGRVRPSPIGIAHGITFGDGTRLNKGSVVDLHGTKDAELLKWFPLNHSYQCKRTDNKGREVSYLKVVDLPAYFKERPPLEESTSYLLGWLAGYFAADGRVTRDGTPMLHSASRDELDFVRAVCARLGIATLGITQQLRQGLGQSQPTPLFRIHLISSDLSEDFFLIAEHRRRFLASNKAYHRTGWQVKGVEQTERVEEVYCAVVERYHAFTLEDNILTGNCFSCQESGDAITFVRKLDGLDFVEAVERLAARAGIQLRYDSAGANKDRQRRDRLMEAVAEAVDFYHHILLEDPRGGPARGYLRSRGFDGDAARRFVLGWAPDGFDVLARHLYDKKFSRDDIAGAGLAFVNRAQKAQDFFRARLMFPIYDRAGAPVGFGGRTLTGDGPKYKNTPDTPLYHKSRLLYGLNWAKAEIGARDEVVICEGYTDVMGFALVGVPNVVATCGTALADEHVQILKAFTRHVVLAYDADVAGQNAAEKWYQWEQRFDIEVKVAALPPGRDPGDLWREDAAALAKSVEGASRFMQFKVDRVLAAADLTSPEGRARTAEELVPVLREHPSELVREQYIQTAAGTLGIDHGWFKEAIARRPARRPSGPDGEWETAERPPVRARQTGGARREEDALRWAIHEPALVADWLDVSLLADPVAHGAFEVLAAHEDFHEALDASEGPVRALLERLAVEEPEADAEPETVRARLLVNTVEPAAERLLRLLVAEDDDRASQVKAQLDSVRSAAASSWASGEAAAMQLVRWISEWTK